MSNEVQKLKPVERSLYRRVFMAAIDDLMSPEAADKRALHAVKIWQSRDAFNEERETSTDAEINRALIGSNVWASFGDILTNNGVDLAEFRRRLGLDREKSG